MYKRTFRIATLNKIVIKNGALLSELEKAVEQKPATPTNKPVYSSNSIKISAPVPGVSIFVPENPIINGQKETDEHGNVKYKSGTYNVTGWVKPGRLTAGGVPKQSLTNSIVVTATPPSAEEAKSLSEGYTKYFGNIDWWKKTLSAIDAAMKSHFGNVSLGKTALGAFSGGSSAIKGMLVDAKRKDPQLYNHINALLMLDNIHNFGSQVDPNSIKPFLDFAQEAANDPNKRFIAVHSQITPSRINPQTGKYETYVSSRESAEYIANQVGASYQPESGRQIGNLSPSSSARKGGVELVSAFSPDRRKDNVDNLKKQHIAISDAAPEISDMLADLFNS